MKLQLFLVFYIYLVFLPLSVQAQQTSWIALLADEVGYHNAYCEFSEGYSAKAELYVWVKPSLGIGGVVFSLDYPDYVLPEGMEINENTVLAYWGDLETGIEIATICIEEESWLVRQTFWIVSHEYSEIQIVPHSNPDSIPILEEVGFTVCHGGHYPFDAIAGLSINQPLYGWLCKEPLDLVVGVEESSWGAIKMLLRN
jgi:hypothetical protein